MEKSEERKFFFFNVKFIQSKLLLYLVQLFLIMKSNRDTQNKNLQPFISIFLSQTKYITHLQDTEEGKFQLCGKKKTRPPIIISVWSGPAYKGGQAVRPLRVRTRVTPCNDK